MIGRIITLEKDHPSGTNLGRDDSSSDNPSVYKCGQTDELSTKFVYQDELSRKFAWTDDPFVCPHYTDRLSDELSISAQVRPRRMIRL